MIWLVAVSCVWAFSFVLIKGTLSGLDSNLVSLIRMALSLIIFLPFLRLRSIKPGDGVWLAGIGAIQFGLMYVLYIAAYKYLPAHMIVLFTTTTPLFVILINDGIEKRFHWLFLIAAICAVGSGAVVKYPTQALSANVIGVLLVQASNIAFAAGQVLYKRYTARHPDQKDAKIFGLLYAGAVIITAGFSFCTVDPAAVHITGTQALSLIYLGIIASGICFFLWNYGAKSVNEGTLAVMNNLKIPLGIIASLVILSEHTDYARLAISIVLMTAALGISEWLQAGQIRAQPAKKS